MHIVPNNEIIVQHIDEFAASQLTNTLRVAPLEFGGKYRGALRAVRECLDGETGREWWLTFYTEGEHENGTIVWNELRTECYATVGVDDTRINMLSRKFRAIGYAYRALDWRSKPSSVYLMAMRLAQLMEERPKLELVDYITNDMFQAEEPTEVETICQMEVVGAQYKDIRRIDTIVVSRSVRVGLEYDQEILCSWPIVFVGNKVAFNQHIPGPVVSMGNLDRHNKVIDMNTKDIRWTASTEHQVFDYVQAEGTAKMRKFHPAENKWVVYEMDSMSIRPTYVEGELEVDAGLTAGAVL